MLSAQFLQSTIQSAGSGLFNPINASSLAIIGDSFAVYNGGISIASPPQAIANVFDSKGFVNWGNVGLRHAFRVIGNAGIGGQTSAQIAARFASDVLIYKPAFVNILAGTNDDDATFLTTQNLQSMYQQALLNGIKVIACTIPPNNNFSTAKNQYHQSVNLWIKNYARNNPGIVVADIAMAVYDTATSFGFLSSLTFDGTHPNSAGAAAMGFRWAKDVAAGFGVATSNDLLTAGIDPTNLLSNPWMTGTGSTAPTNWNGLGTQTISYVSRTDGIAGKWVQLALTGNNTGGLTTNVTVDGSALSVGDRVYAEIEFDLDSLGTSVAANTQRMLLTLQAYNGSTFFAATQDLYWDASYVNVACPFPNGILQTPIFQVPVATTLMQLYINVGGAGNFRVARAALRKVPLTVTNV